MNGLFYNWFHIQGAPDYKAHRIEDTAVKCLTGFALCNGHQPFQDYKITSKSKCKPRSSTCKKNMKKQVAEL